MLAHCLYNDLKLENHPVRFASCIMLPTALHGLNVSYYSNEDERLLNESKIILD